MLENERQWQTVMRLEAGKMVRHLMVVAWLYSVVNPRTEQPAQHSTGATEQGPRELVVILALQVKGEMRLEVRSVTVAASGRLLMVNPICPYSVHPAPRGPSMLAVEQSVDGVVTLDVRLRCEGTSMRRKGAGEDFQPQLNRTTIYP